MGNKNTKISFEFDRPAYFTSGCVTGKVHLDITGDNELSNVELICVAVKGTLIRKPRNNNNPPWNIYESQTIILATPQQPETQLNFKKGHYSWPFSIPLNAYLPPSFFTQADHLFYFVNVTFKKAWFRRNASYSEQIKIFPHVDLGQSPNIPFKFNDNKQNTNGIVLNGTLNKMAFIRGEKIKCKLEIFNTNRLFIKNIVISLCYKALVDPKMTNIYARASNYIHTVLEQPVTSITGTREEMISELVDVEIPSVYMPPTFYYSFDVHGILDHARRSINIIYSLNTEMKVEGVLTNVNASVPIIIGTIPRRDEQNQLPVTTYPNPTDDTNISDDKE